MKKKLVAKGIHVAISAALGLAGIGLVQAQTPNPRYDITTPGHNIRKVVIYSQSQTGGHPQSRIYLRRHLAYLATKYGFTLDSSASSSSTFNANLNVLKGAQILIASNGDGNVFTTATAQDSVIRFVQRDGNALLMVHAAAAFIPCPTSGSELVDNANCKFLARIAIRQYYHHNSAGTRANLYADSVEAGQPVPGTGTTALCGTSTTQTIPLLVATQNHGIKSDETKNIYLSRDERGQVLPRSWTALKDEWYTYRTAWDGGSSYLNVRAQPARLYGISPSAGTATDGIIGSFEGPVNVLFTMEENGMTTSSGSSVRAVCPVLGNHPQIWTRKMGKGLSAYNFTGHDENEAANGGSNQIYTQQDSAYVRINWRLMRYLAGDFSGCMDPNYEEYNPEATVSLLTGRDSSDWNDYKTANPSKAGNPAACKTLKVVSIKAVENNSIAGISASRHSIRISAYESGTYRISVTDLKGRQVFAQKMAGGLNRSLEVPGLQMGTYFVRVTSPKGKAYVERVGLY